MTCNGSTKMARGAIKGLLHQINLQLRCALGALDVPGDFKMYNIDGPFTESALKTIAVYFELRKIGFALHLLSVAC